MTSYVIGQTLAVAAVLSIDSLASGLAYGANKIKIPVRSAIIIACVCAFTFGLTLISGKVLQPYLPLSPLKYISFAILMAIGVFKLFEAAIKIFMKKSGKTQLKFPLCKRKFMLKILQDETQADANKDKVLSAREALSLAAALSPDGLAVGISAGLAGLPAAAAISFALVLGFFALIFGQTAGKKLAQKTKINLSWLSAVIFIAMAVGKLC